MVVIAIDGPAAAGKGTLAKQLSSKLGYAHLDTGSLYRAIGYMALSSSISLGDVDRLCALVPEITPQILSALNLKEEKIGEAASKIGVYPRIREALISYQRNFASHPPDGKEGAILEGRDIGTVICPDAHVKIFITASPEVRARRRWLELKGHGIERDFNIVLEDVRRRDVRDRMRKVAPLKPAYDAHIIITDTLDPESVLSSALKIIENKAVKGDLEKRA